jgi:FkbM family methyltransferase
MGDTAVYFVSRGAYKVLAYEPFQAAAALAMRNIKRNGVEDRVHLVCAGAASRSCRSIVSYDSRVPSTHMCALPDNAVGAPLTGRWTRQEEVLLLSFGDILHDAVKSAQGRHIVVKIDCEGAEFDILLTEPLPDSFGQVSQLLIETHDRQPDPIIKLLTEAGFTVEVTRKESRRLAYLLKAQRSVSPSPVDWKN